MAKLLFHGGEGFGYRRISIDVKLKWFDGIFATEEAAVSPLGKERHPIRVW